MRVNFIRKQLLLQHSPTPNSQQDEVFSKLKAIDIGCGAGILSESLTRLGIGSVTGIDPTDKCVSLANEHLTRYSSELKPRLTYENTTLEKVLEKSGTEQYDLVCCSEVVEHVDNQAQFLQDCLKLVKPETGRLFVSTIAKTPESYFLTIFSK